MLTSAAPLGVSLDLAGAGVNLHSKVNKSEKFRCPSSLWDTKIPMGAGNDSHTMFPKGDCTPLTSCNVYLIHCNYIWFQQTTLQLYS